MRRRYNITKLPDYNQTEIIYRLSNFFKFIVVRNPVDKLISAYNDRLVGDPAPYRKLVQHIIATYRPGADSKTIEAAKSVTFREFLLYYANAFRSDITQEKHFLNTQRVCYPCQVEYDYIAKLETQAADARYIINEKLAGRGADTIFNVHSHREGASVYKELPELHDLKVDELDGLKNMFSWDMNLFGYSIDYHNGSFRAKCGVGDNGCC